MQQPLSLESLVLRALLCSQARTLVTDAVVNESADPGLLLKRYERQIRELKQELAMRDMLRCERDDTLMCFKAANLRPGQETTFFRGHVSRGSAAGQPGRQVGSRLQQAFYRLQALVRAMRGRVNLLGARCSQTPILRRLHVRVPSGRTHTSYDDLSESEQRELQALATQYFSGQVGTSQARPT